MKKLNNNKIIYLEFLRVFSICAVVLIHTVNSALILNTKTSIVDLIIYRSIYNLTCWAVPIFLMITGALLLNPLKEISLGKLFNKYILRMLLILIVFGTIYAWIEIVFIERSINLLQLSHAIFNMVQGETWAHMWYLYMLIGLYIVTPFLKKIITYSNKAEIKYFLIITFIFNSIIPTAEHFLDIKVGIYIPIITIYPFYYVLGYYLSQINITTKKIKLVYSLGLFNIIILILCSFLQNYFGVGKIKFLSAYNSPVIITFSISIYIFMREQSYKLDEWYSKFISLLSRCSFGIYIIHMFFLNLFLKFFKFTPFNYPFFIGIPIFWISVFLCSFSLTFILTKIPIINKYL
ncbi:acyltransferase [Clostridium sp. DJ247]|uniref:acyltransferase n=1 Tax=Clostridium sp. DJ247 TaxID=2726188 RepID=UPI00162857CD|nr:acyltransferase family protein [Clostridium sp. DJ247]MBC2581943.1 acyltransferase family protein [Clostridium sp. DJ247]